MVVLKGFWDKIWDMCRCKKSNIGEMEGGFKVLIFNQCMMTALPARDRNLRAVCAQRLRSWTLACFKLKPVGAFTWMNHVLTKKELSEKDIKRRNDSPALRWKLVCLKIHDGDMY